MLYQSVCLFFQATFIAHGPAFKKNYVSEPFANIELYNLMCGELTTNLQHSSNIHLLEIFSRSARHQSFP